LELNVRLFKLDNTRVFMFVYAFIPFPTHTALKLIGMPRVGMPLTSSYGWHDIAVVDLVAFLPSFINRLRDGATVILRSFTINKVMFYFKTLNYAGVYIQ
jgi:hypothetical protein